MGRGESGRSGVRLEVRVESAERELRSLQSWLRSDPEARRSAVVELHGSVPRPGEMGTALDVLELVTGNGWSAASFVMAVVAWRRTQPQRPRVEIRRAGTVIVLTDCSEEEIERATRALEAAQADGAAE
ncbi:effector-associated constant component EACC1 [Streptomyces sp. NBC_00328]